jgi:hypothetical protein
VISARVAGAESSTPRFASEVRCILIVGTIVCQSSNDVQVNT